MNAFVFYPVLLDYFFFFPKLPSNFSSQLGQMLSADKSACSGVAFFADVALALETTAFAFWGPFWVALAFLGFVAAAGAAGCPALAFAADFGITAFGLCVDFKVVGFLGFTSEATVATGCPALALVADFSADVIFGSFIVR
jgi:hypothetical protein